MYLCNSIRFTSDWNGLSAGDEFKMCGVFSGTSSIPSKRIVRYVIGTSSSETPFNAHLFRGHEFHYSDVQLDTSVTYGYHLDRGVGIEGSKDGAISRNTLGSYTHLHPVAARKMFADFCDLCRKWKITRT